LEFSETQGIVIATSNLPENLDRALWRRFDLVLEFPKPTKSELTNYTNGIKAKFRLGRKASIKGLSTARTYADAEKVVEAEARRIALAEAEGR
jgi:SpoVK/Ycf46/Vps4 family AAA+-type ATPase